MLDKEYKYYKENQKTLLEKYQRKVLVIRGEKIVGVYDDEATAYKESILKYKIGTFLIQKCVPEGESIQTFYSRVIFK